MSGGTRAGGRDRARQRHPAASWAPDHELLRRLLADQLAAEGHPWPRLGATLLGVRGLLGLDRAAFAAAMGIDPGRLAAMEDGRSADPGGGGAHHQGQRA